MKYGEITLGQVEAVINKLGGMDGVRRLLADELTVTVKGAAFQVWETLKLGTSLATADEFRGALKRAGFKISDWATDILGKPAFKVATEETEVDLVVVSVAGLGFASGATREDIYNRAQKLGLKLCPPEVGPQLRLQYHDQLESEWLFVAMEPIADSDGYSSVFRVERRGDGLWLDSYDGRSESFWHDRNRWVFVRPKAS